MNLFTSFFVALLGSMLLVPPLMRVSNWLHLMDVPDEGRKQHTESIPRSGGIAIVLGALIPILYWLSRDGGLASELQLGVLGGGAIIVVFGLLDDRIGLNWKWKFLGQIVAVIVAMLGGLLIEIVPFFGIEPVSPFLSYPLTALFMLGVTNAINLSDGLDGLAAGTSLLSLSAIAWLALQAEGAGLTVALVALALMGGICGFLRYNNYPAMVFMGDSGSQFLGFMTAALAVVLTQEVNRALNPALILLLLGIPILDTLTVMVWRIRRGRSPFLPDRNHFHHRLLEFGFRHYEAVSAIYLAQAVLIGVAMLTRFESDPMVVGIYIAFSALVLGFFRWARMAGWRLHKAEQATVEAHRGSLTSRLPWLPQASALATAYAIGTFLALAPLAVESFRPSVTAGEGTLAGLSILAALLLGALGLVWIMPPVVPAWRQNVTRISVYVAAVCSVYLLAAVPGAVWAPSWAVNVFVLVLATLLVLAIRMTDPEEFRTTPLDLLVLFFVLIAFFLPQQQDGPFAGLQLSDAVVRLALLFYGGEFLLAKGSRYFRPIPLFAAVCLGLVAVRGVTG